MAKSTSFTLGDHFADFVETKVAEGRYASASDVVRAGLRLLEDQETQLAALRAALARLALKSRSSMSPTGYRPEAVGSTGPVPDGRDWR